MVYIFFFKLFIIKFSCRGKQIETTYLFPAHINYIANYFKPLFVTAWSLTNPILEQLLWQMSYRRQIDLLSEPSKLLYNIFSSI